MSKNYEQIYEKILDYEEHLHRKNQRKIRIGIKVNIFVPLVFLLLCFAFPDTDIIFLVLWIVSLFGIATYLIYVEYSDYKLRRKLNEFGISDSRSELNLMGDSVHQIDQALDEKLDSVEERIEKERERFAAEMGRLNQEKENAKKEAIERLKKTGDKIRGPKE